MYTSIYAADRDPKEKDIVKRMQINYELDQDTLDNEYINTLEKVFSTVDPDDMYGFGQLLEILRSSEVTKNPMEIFQQYKLKDNPDFSHGKYGKVPEFFSMVGFSYWLLFDDTHSSTRNKHDQGWKIHITAQPHSAKKIAELILPLLLTNTKKRIAFKIVASLPLMRTLWGFKNVIDKDSQAGKFLVIYPDDAEEAYQLVQMIDEIFLKAKKSGILNDSDFFPLIGDAKVGYSGGVYVRYGKFSDNPEQGGKRVKTVDAFDKTLDFKSPAQDTRHALLLIDDFLFVDDNRYYPWPNFMNKGTKEWEKTESPFKDLPLTWVDANNPNCRIKSWNDRPHSWETCNDRLEKNDDKKSDETTTMQEATKLPLGPHQSLRSLRPLERKNAKINLFADDKKSVTESTLGDVKKEEYMRQGLMRALKNENERDKASSNSYSESSSSTTTNIDHGKKEGSMKRGLLKALKSDATTAIESSSKQR